MITGNRGDTVESFGCVLPPVVVRRLRAVTGTQQNIAQVELVPVLLALWRWRVLFAEVGRRVVVFIDNDSARFGLVHGTSPVAASRALIEAIWHELARLQAAAWFERVPSSGNPADGPSRLEFKGLEELGRNISVVDAPPLTAQRLSVLELG